MSHGSSLRSFLEEEGDMISSITQREDSEACTERRKLEDTWRIRVMYNICKLRNVRGYPELGQRHETAGSFSNTIGGNKALLTP